MNIFSDRIIRYRIPIIVLFLTVTILMAFQLPRGEIDPDMKSHLPENLTSRIDTDRIDELFGGTEMLMVLIRADDVLDPETLDRVRRISKQVNRIKGVDKVMSLFDLKSIRGEGGAMIVEPAVRRIPRTESQRELLRKEIEENDIVYGSVVSRDFTLAAIIAVLKDDVSDSYIVPEIKKVVENNPGAEETIIGGLPYMRTVVTRYIQGDMRRLLPVGILLMLAFLYACFRQLRGVLLPFFVVLMSIIVAMGLVPVIGWKIQILTIIVPVILIAVANDYGIHLIARYQELNVQGNPYSKKDLAKKVFESLNRPVLLTGLTTMAGMLCLFGHRIVSARHMGVLACTGIVFALVASLFFIPAVLSFLPKGKHVLPARDNGRKRPPLERMLLFFGDFVSTRPRLIIFCALVLLLVSAAGIFRVVIDADPNNYFSENHPIVQASKLINEKLGGMQNVSVVYRGDMKDPLMMRKIDTMEQILDRMPEVGNTTSIARVVRQMSRALNDEWEPWYDRIPDHMNAVAQYFELYAMSGDAKDFEKLVDFPYEHAMLTARVNTTSTPRLNRVIDTIKELIEGDPDVMLIGGFGLVLSDIARLVITGQILSLALATIIVTILVMIVFRSFAAGLISGIPLALSITILFGLMGVFGIELNIATAMLSSIMIGVGIDYTIHFLWRYREERRGGLDAVDAVKRTLTTTGRGIVFNAFSVIVGFVVLLLSGFMPVKFFGFLVVVSIIACLLGALVLIPAVCLVIRPKFLEL